MISEAVASASSHTGRKSIRALMSAIFLCAVTTLQDEDCIAQFNEPKKILLHRFSCMTQQALVGCELLKSTDPVILQALTLFLVRLALFHSGHSPLVVRAISFTTHLH